MANWLKILKEYVDALETALGNLTGDMSAVTQGEAATLAAFLLNFREMSRAHNQARICLVVPDLSNLASDLPNTAIKAELDKVGTVTVLDEAGVDGGQEDWDFYDIVVVGSNTYAAFTNSNLDDLILLKVPVLVCNRDVAIHLKMGSTQTQSTSDVNEYCETIHNRVMYRVFGSVGEKILFSEGTQSDRLDMSDASLTEQVLMVDTTADGNTKAVIGWLPMEDGVGGSNTLDDDTDLPACRIFAGCFVGADKLTDLGTLLLRSMARNIMQASISPSIALKASAAQVAAILNDTADMQPRLGKMLFSMDFWSDVVEEIVVTGAQATPAITGGNVVVADLPDTATVVRAVVMMKYRMVENDNAAENSLDADAALPMQVDDSGDTGWLSCIDFVDEMCKIAATTREGGDVIIGDIDVAARVDGNDTYDFQWLNAKAHLANLRFNDVQMGIRIWYSV